MRPVNQDRGGGALFGFAKELFTFGKGQIARFGGVSGCEAGQRRGAIADDFSLEFFGNLRGGKCVHSGFGWLQAAGRLEIRSQYHGQAMTIQHLLSTSRSFLFPSRNAARKRK